MPERRKHTEKHTDDTNCPCAFSILPQHYGTKNRHVVWKNTHAKHKATILNKYNPLIDNSIRNWQFFWHAPCPIFSERVKQQSPIFKTL